MSEQFTSPVLETTQVDVSTLKEENNSTNSEPITDSEGQFHTDDDEDDDRNHKHRRREPRLLSIDNNDQEHYMNQHNRKRMRSSDNGQNSFGTDFHGLVSKQFSPRAEKRHPGVISHARNSMETFSRTRMNQSSRPSAATGRIKNQGNWTQHDAKFHSLGRMDFPSHMASQGPPMRPNLFMGTGLLNGVPGQTGSWGSYGFMSGMGNGILDPIHPLGALPPALNPLLDLNVPRQRCRDFEELGFCLRGDMCPMEHGVNRIVIDDMQSLSQFNLPVSVPKTNILGMQSEQFIEPTAVASPSLVVGDKLVSANEAKPGLASDVQQTAWFAPSAIGNDADVYDPDQPLWNNGQPEASIDLPLPGDANEQMWIADSSVHDGVVNEHLNQNLNVSHGRRSTKPSFRGRNQSKRKFGTRRVNNFEIPKTELAGLPGAGQEKTTATADSVVRASGIQFGTQTGRISQRASRTLYVNGIPQEQNKWDALLSHFQNFGEVLDIYIPHNSEKAFVQFSKREEAEAALKAPDAVMGNRFIKLLWAKRDRINDEGESSVLGKPFHPQSLMLPSVSSVPNKTKANLLCASPKVNDTPSTKKAVPLGFSKALPVNGVKSRQPDNKKFESLELLEELRKKQEALDRKRDEFRRQLEKLAKQAGSIKKTSDDGKDLKAENDSDSKKADAAENVHVVTCKEDKKSDDNHTAAFRIIPPLPSEIAEVPVLKDHFSTFGEVLSIVLECTEAQNQDLNLKPSACFSACVTYATKQSAERAFVTGTSCKGHDLKFMWLSAPVNSNENCSDQSNTQSVKSAGAEIQSVQSFFQSPSSAIGESISSSSTEAIDRSGKSSDCEVKTNGTSVTYSENLQIVPSSSHECQPSCSVGEVAHSVDDKLPH